MLSEYSTRLVNKQIVDPFIGVQVVKYNSTEEFWFISRCMSNLVHLYVMSNGKGSETLVDIRYIRLVDEDESLISPREYLEKYYANDIDINTLNSFYRP